jgi:hypothetical protein
VQLNNNYKFNNPFDVGKDELELEFKTYRVDPTISDVVIETVRILEGQQQLAEKQVDESLSDTATMVGVELPEIAGAEEEHNLILKVWYKYIQNGEEKKGNYQKPLGRITLINPE